MNEQVYICELCLQAYEPREKGKGIIRELKEFKGYTLDLRLQQFRKLHIGYDGFYPEFIEFASKKGQRLLAQMHEEVTR